MDTTKHIRMHKALSMYEKNKNKKEKMENILCNHDINDAETTIQRLPLRTFIYPKHIYGVCKCCEKAFEFEVIDGAMVLFEDEIKSAKEE